MWANLSLILLCLVVSDWATVFLKLAAMQTEIAPTWTSLRAMATSAYLMAGLLLYGAGMLLWIMVLAQNRVSAGIMLFSVHYIHLMLLARYVFKEPIRWTMWAGAVFVMLGVALCSAGNLSGPPS